MGEKVGRNKIPRSSGMPPPSAAGTAEYRRGHGTLILGKLIGPAKCGIPLAPRYVTADIELSPPTLASQFGNTPHDQLRSAPH